MVQQITKNAITRAKNFPPVVRTNAVSTREEYAKEEATNNATPADQWFGYGILLITNTIYQSTTPCTATPTIF